MTDEERIRQEGETMPGTSAGETPGLNNATEPTAEEIEAAGFDAGECLAEGADETPVSEETGKVDPITGIAETEATKTFTQSQMDEIAGRARKEGRERALRDMFSRYGVSSSEELDDMFGDAQRFAIAQTELADRSKAWEEADAARNAELAEVKERVALLESGIDKSRYEDARLILRGKGLDVTSENIAQELATHPEWKPAEPEADQKPVAGGMFRKAQEPESAAKIIVPKMQTLGNEGARSPDPEMTERERALRMFKV